MRPNGISVVIPAYNCSAFIAETLDSVFAQTQPVDEVVLVNDGSPDTPALERALEPYRSRLQYLVQANAGVSAARNTAIRAATGSFLAFLDSDDLWKPAFIEKHMAMFAADPTLDLAYGNGVRFGDSPDAGQLVMDVSPSSGEVTFERLIRLECNINTACVARREIVLRAGLYDESLRTSEDFDLWLRVVKAGGRVAYHRDVTMMSRLRPGSLSWHQHWMYRDFLRVLDKAAARDDLTPAEGKAIEAQQRDYRARFALYEGKRALLEGDSKSAISAFRSANEYLRNWKLTATIAGLRLAPAPIRSLYRWRNRYVFGSESLR